MSRIIASTVLRTQSSRLPNKVLYSLAGKPSFLHIFERLEQYVKPDIKIIGTTKAASDDIIEFVARQHGFEVYRGAEDTSARQINMMRKIDLQDDDIIVMLAGDSPLAICAHVPFAIEQLRATKRDWFYSLRKQGSITWMAGMAPLMRGARWEEYYLGGCKQTIALVGCASRPRSCLQYVLCKLPKRYNAPWPWGPLHLDWPTQALQLKHIYAELYHGKPIDLWDVYQFFEERPLLARRTEREVPLSYDQATFAMREREAQEIMNIGDYILVEWDEDE